MSDADALAEASSRPPTHIMRGGPSSRRRVTAAPRRVSSAPNLRTSPSLDSTSTSQDGTSSSDFVSFSNSSESHPQHLQESGSPPVAPSHEDQALRSTESLPAHQPSQQQPPNLESTSQTLEEIHRAIRELQRRERRRGARGFWITVRAFFGYGPEGSAARRDVVSLVGRFIFDLGQLGATVALLSLAAMKKSPTDSTVSEWRACRRPLGIWCAIWCIRVILGCVMAFWGYRRKSRRSMEQSERSSEQSGDPEPSHPSADNNEASSPVVSPRRSRPRRTEAGSGLQVSALTFARLTTLLSLFSTTWFVTAHVLIYTSVDTCRISAPHLWWLTFGIICIGYLIIVEVLLVAFVVFILGPLIFLLLNLILICMGRHPLRHPTHINPEVGKLPQKMVDLIPLVLYIPAPTPKEPTLGKTPQDSPTPQTGHNADVIVPPLAVPETARVHSYPPTERAAIPPATLPANSSAQRPRRLFTFRRIRPRKAPKGEGKVEKGKEKISGDGPEGGQLYEDKWERGDYPFVKLENNRAACAICLCDFEEPRRVRYSVDSRPAEDLDGAEKGIYDSPTKSHHDKILRLADAGEGAQPLRLLACAHVFHKSCLDPWLTEVSGRCPVCQRPVEVDDPGKPVEDRRRQRADRG